MLVFNDIYIFLHYIIDPKNQGRSQKNWAYLLVLHLLFFFIQYSNLKKYVSGQKSSNKLTHGLKTLYI